MLGPLLKTGLLLLGNIPKPLANSVLIHLGLPTAAPVTDAAIHKKMFPPGNITLIISNEEMNDIMKLSNSFEEFDLLIKDVNKTIKNIVKEPKGEFLGMLIGTLGASLLGNLLKGKRKMEAGKRHS